MIEMKESFFGNILRAMFFLLLVGAMSMVTLGCDSLDDDDDSDGGAVATTTAPTGETVTVVAGASEPVASGTPHISTTSILWKPVSESDHNLVILLPSNYSGVTVKVLSSDRKSVV